MIPDSHEPIPNELYFLRIAVSHRYVSDKTGDSVRAVRGLTLRKVDQRTPEALGDRHSNVGQHRFGVFQRVGYFELKVDAKAGRKWQPIGLQVPSDYKASYTAGLYKDALARPDPGDGDLDSHGFFDESEGAFDGEILLL